MTHRERERKYEPGPRSPLPDLERLPGVTVEPSSRVDVLEAVYHDTADLRLAAARVTLRRRTGGSDAGWHLKLPGAAGDRTEVRESLGAEDEVPESLGAAVQLHTRGHELTPVATVRTRRTLHELRDSTGRVLAELCEDEVTARRCPAEEGEPADVWGEWELELVEGSDELLRAADELIRAAGAGPASVPSKLARALGDRLPRPRWTGPEPEPDSLGLPACLVVQSVLRQQVAELASRDPRVRLDMPDSVHKMRVAMRRLRSTLATYRPLFDREQSERLRVELQRVANVLGEARDAEVVGGRMATLLEAEPAELVLGGVSARIEHQRARRYHDGSAHAHEVLGSEDYFALFDELDRFVEEPPWTALAQEPADEVLRPRLRREWRRTRRRARAAAELEEGRARDERLHEVRKAAKRARYAAEALTVLYGRPSKRLGKAAKRVQTVLGEHHDTVVTRQLLRELGVQAHLSGDNGFTFGRLHAREQVHAAAALRAYERAWTRADRKKLRRWLG